MTKPLPQGATAPTHDHQPRVTECPECLGAGWLEAPWYVIGSQMVYHKGRTFYVADCDHCDGTGEVALCEHGHEVARDGFCDACYEIAGKWDGTRCTHGMVASCVVCDADVIDPPAPAAVALSANAEAA